MPVETKGKRRLGLRGWAILWVLALALSAPMPSETKQIETFCMVMAGGAMYIGLVLRRFCLGCAGGQIGLVAALNVAPRLHFPSFWNVPISLWAGPLLAILAVQFALGGATLGPLLLNLVGYTALVGLGLSAGAHYSLLGLPLGWLLLILQALLYRGLHASRNPQLADWTSLVIMIAIYLMNILLPEVLYQYGLVHSPY